MKAIVYTEYGPPEVLQLKEVAKPLPKDKEGVYLWATFEPPQLLHMLWLKLPRRTGMLKTDTKREMSSSRWPITTMLDNQEKLK